MVARFQVKFANKNLGREYQIIMDRHSERHQRALRGAVEEARTITLREARINISSAGRFGPRWTEGLQAEILREGDDVVTRYTHKIPYWSVFQFGKVIHGQPLLWIPFSFARDAQRVRARDYGPLFKVVRRSDDLPMLFSVASKEPKYFGKEQVTIPKKFKVLEIIELVAGQIARFFVERLGRG
jgi:hypothetical protein